MPEQPIRLAVVSSQDVIARGLTAMLADYPERVIVTALPSAFAPAPGVDVILYDTHCLHNADGADLDHILAETSAIVVLYSRDLRPDLRARALAKGCKAWVSMSIHPKDLVEAIELAMDGQPLPEQEGQLGEEVGLSPREVEILALVTQGHSNQEIADRLFLTINTLKTHIRSAYRKIRVTSRAQAVAWALQNGFPPPDRF